MSRELLPEGPYTAVAVRHNVQWGKTNGGGEQIVVPLRIVEGPHANKVRTYFGYFTEKTRDRTMESLRYMGWTGDDLLNLGPLDQLVEIVVEHDEYKGDVRDRIAWINARGGGKIKLNNPMGESELRIFAQSMRQRAAQIAEVQGEKYSAAPAGGETSGSSVDDGYFNDDPGPGDGLPF